MVDKKEGPCVGQKYERWITSSRLCVLGKIFPDASDWCVLVGCRMNGNWMLLTKKQSDWGSIHGHDQWWIRLRRLDACYVCNMILSLEIERWASIKKWWVQPAKHMYYQIHNFAIISEIWRSFFYTCALGEDGWIPIALTSLNIDEFTIFFTSYWIHNVGSRHANWPGYIATKIKAAMIDRTCYSCSKKSPMNYLASCYIYRRDRGEVFEKGSNPESMEEILILWMLLKIRRNARALC
jgi:hypothetical protein